MKEKENTIAWKSANRAVELIKNFNTENKMIFDAWDEADDTPLFAPGACLAEDAAIIYKWLIDGDCDPIYVANLWHITVDFYPEAQYQLMCDLWDEIIKCNSQKEKATWKIIEKIERTEEIEKEIREITLKKNQLNTCKNCLICEYESELEEWREE